MLRHKDEAAFQGENICFSGDSFITLYLHLK